MALSNDTEGNCFFCGEIFLGPHIVWDSRRDNVTLCLHPKCAKRLAIHIGREAMECEKNERNKTKPKKKKIVKPEKDLTKDIIRDLIKEVVEDLDIDEDLVTDSAHFQHDIGLDSMAYIEIFALLEKKFSISMPDSEMKDMDTIDRCTELVKEYKMKS